MRIALPDGGAVTCNLAAAPPQNGVAGPERLARRRRRRRSLLPAGQGRPDHRRHPDRSPGATGSCRPAPATPTRSSRCGRQAFPEEGDVMTPDLPQRHGRSMRTEPLCDVAGAGDRGTIDLMVLYTPARRGPCRHGGHGRRGDDPAAERGRPAARREFRRQCPPRPQPAGRLCRGRRSRRRPRSPERQPARLSSTRSRRCATSTRPTSST